MAKKPQLLKLSYPTVFPELNKSKGLPADQQHTEITVLPMKHKHFRKMELLPDNKKMHFLMEALTGLKITDIDELDIDDSAELTKIIMGYMSKYLSIAKEMAV